MFFQLSRNPAAPGSSPGRSLFQRSTGKFFRLNSLNSCDHTQAWIKFSDKNIEDSNSARQGRTNPPHHGNSRKQKKSQKNNKCLILTNQGEIWRLTRSSVRTSELSLHRAHDRLVRLQQVGTCTDLTIGQDCVDLFIFERIFHLSIFSKDCSLSSCLHLVKTF